MSSMIDREKKWIFVHVPRTGGTAIAYALQDHFEDHGLEYGVYTHRRLEDFNVEWWRYFKFSVIRNPWDMCMSWMCWHKDHGNDIPLDFAVEKVAQPILFDMDRMDLVLRFERLEKDFTLLCEMLRIERPFLKAMNTSKHSNYRIYYNDEQRQRVAERFSWSIEAFGYEF